MRWFCESCLNTYLFTLSLTHTHSHTHTYPCIQGLRVLGCRAEKAILDARILLLSQYTEYTEEGGSEGGGGKGGSWIARRSLRGIEGWMLDAYLKVLPQHDVRLMLRISIINRSLFVGNLDVRVCVVCTIMNHSHS